MHKWKQSSFIFFRTFSFSRNMNKLRKWWQFIFILHMCSAHYGNATSNNSCSVYSSLDTDDFWISLGLCIPCIQLSGCGFCQSTLQCMNGTSYGPNNGFPCAVWTYSTDKCRVFARKRKKHATVKKMTERQRQQ